MHIIQMNILYCIKCYILPHCSFCRSTPLIFAAAKGQASVVECLIRNGADVSATGQHQYAALHVAALYGHPSTVSMLLQHKASTEVKNIRGCVDFCVQLLQ